MTLFGKLWLSAILLALAGATLASSTRMSDRFMRVFFMLVLVGFFGAVWMFPFAL